MTGSTGSNPLRSAAVLIGFDGYPVDAEVDDLQGAVNDCRAVAKLLVKHGMVYEQDIYTHLYSHDRKLDVGVISSLEGTRGLVPDRHFPQDKNVGASTLGRSFSQLLQHLSAEGFERLYVYLSGHGGDFQMYMPPISVLMCSDYMGGQGNHNYGLLAFGELQNHVHNAGGFTEAILIADCCRTALSALTKNPDLGSGPKWRGQLRCITIKPTVYNTPTTEREFEVDGHPVFHGVFTQALLSAIDQGMQKVHSGRPVSWRDVCDDVASTKQSIEFQQLASYPVIQLGVAAVGSTTVGVELSESTIGVKNMPVIPTSNGYERFPVDIAMAGDSLQPGDHGDRDVIRNTDQESVDVLNNSVGINNGLNQVPPRQLLKYILDSRLLVTAIIQLDKEFHYLEEFGRLVLMRAS